MLKKIIILGTILGLSSLSFGEDLKHYQLEKPTITIEEENVDKLSQEIKLLQSTYHCKEKQWLKSCQKYKKTLIALCANDKKSNTSFFPIKKPKKITPTSKASGMINLGKQAWKFIEDKKAVVNVKTDKATATPLEAKHWSQLAGWKKPKSYKFNIEYKNGWGFKVIKLSGRLIYTYGGQLEGKGQYLTNVSVIPEKVSVSWGHNLNARVEIMEPINMNTVEDPLAGMEVAIKWSVGTLNKEQEAVVFFVSGNGDIDFYN